MTSYGHLLSFHDQILFSGELHHSRDLLFCRWPCLPPIRQLLITFKRRKVIATNPVAKITIYRSLQLANLWFFSIPLYKTTAQINKTSLKYDRLGLISYSRWFVPHILRQGCFVISLYQGCQTFFTGQNQTAKKLNQKRTKPRNRLFLL